MNRNAADILNLISKLTFRRTFNFLKVIVSYYLSRIFRQPIVAGSPLSVSIEPTTSCNLRCPECISGLRNFSRPTGMLDFSSSEKIINELSADILYMIFYFQGEPYLNRDFLKIVKHASKKKIYTATSTNAHYLDDNKAKETVESGLDRLIISIDGTTQDVYSNYRVGGNLDKVIEGAKNVVMWKKKLNSKTPYIIFQFLVVRPNEHQIDEVKKLGSDIGVDEVAFKTAQVYDYQNGNLLIPENEMYSRYIRKGENYILKNKLLNHCWRLWSSSVITWDGKVVPCCFDKDASHSFGEISKGSFASIWKNEKYQSFRSAVLTSRKENEICTNCSEGTKVWS